ncbi:hypothetical protein GC087_25700 (plasmid) [Pantoea sp. JZ2]|uniref:BRO-N domain-containing protein n=1 Tax=Pantoea sp. JZ2 TaxID=2654189 RepID=UPI002B4A76F1|nr:Bro-N domain-containing protein [Pantoea sp. JZ2]WRH15964.1 hypothetical protein GC087_25700 [Pantoea sp. JZ2]
MTNTSRITSVFQFESSAKIRTFTINGNPWFFATDVCDALGLTNNRDALLKLDDDEKDTVGLTDSQPGMGPQSISIISESGLYTLILRCRDAVRKGTIPYRFRKWVTSEVLPSIRQTGTYAHCQPDLLPAEPESTMRLPTPDAVKRKRTKRLLRALLKSGVPVILKEMRENQYHYSNCDVGPAEVIPLLCLITAEGCNCMLYWQSWQATTMTCPEPGVSLKRSACIWQNTESCWQNWQRMGNTLRS